MELRHLRYFVVVAEERNFTRAAKLLNIAQPPLTRQIRQLEDEIGAELFDRSTRPLRLTEAGRLLYESALNVLTSLDQLRGTMRQFVGKGRRRFVIGFVGSALYGRLPEVIRRFREFATHIEVSVIELSTVDQIAALKDARIDAGFGRLRIDDPAIRRIVLAEESLMAVVPVGHRFAATPSFRLADLIDEPLLVYPRPARPSYADQILGVFRDLGLTPSAVQEVRELQTAVGLVAAHAGLCIVPESVQRLQRDDVIYVPIADQAARSPILMFHRAGDVSLDLAKLIEISFEAYVVESATHD